MCKTLKYCFHSDSCFWHSYCSCKSAQRIWELPDFYGCSTVKFIHSCPHRWIKTLEGQSYSSVFRSNKICSCTHVFDDFEYSYRWGHCRALQGLGPSQLGRYTSNRLWQVALMMYHRLKVADRWDITSSIKPDLFYSDGFQSEWCLFVLYDLRESSVLVPNVHRLNTASLTT